MKQKQTFRGVVIKTTLLGAPPRVPQLRTVPADGSRVRVSREVAGRGGKGVSVITGLPLNDDALEALATQLKKSCGAGGVAREGRIEIQGDHRDKLVQDLTARGFKAKRAGG